MSPSFLVTRPSIAVISPVFLMTRPSTSPNAAATLLYVLPPTVRLGGTMLPSLPTAAPPPIMDSVPLSWLTFTVSVSAVPAATLTTWRWPPAMVVPTDTVLARSARLPLPMATALSAPIATCAPLPIAVAPLATAFADVPKAVWF